MLAKPVGYLSAAASMRKISLSLTGKAKCGVLNPKLHRRVQRSYKLYVSKADIIGKQTGKAIKTHRQAVQIGKVSSRLRLPTGN